MVEIGNLPDKDKVMARRKRKRGVVTNTMPIMELIDIVGGQVVAGLLLGVSQMAVSRWINGGHPSIQSQIMVNALVSAYRARVSWLTKLLIERTSGNDKPWTFKIISETWSLENMGFHGRISIKVNKYKRSEVVAAIAKDSLGFNCITSPGVISFHRDDVVHHYYLDDGIVNVHDLTAITKMIAGKE